MFETVVPRETAMLMAKILCLLCLTPVLAQEDVRKSGSMKLISRFLACPFRARAGPHRSAQKSRSSSRHSLDLPCI